MARRSHNDTAALTTPVASSPAASLELLEEEAEHLRANKSRGNDGRYVPRYPGLFVPPVPAGFDRAAFREGLVAALKPGKRCYLETLAERMNKTVDDTRAGIELLTWFGLGWSTDDAKYTLAMAMLSDAEWAKAHEASMRTSWVLHTPDGGRAFGVVELSRVSLG